MALRSLSTTALRNELDRREKGAGKLAAQHRKLAARLAEIDSELADLGVNGVARRGPGRPPGRRGPGRPPKAGRRARAKNALSLHEALAKVVRIGSTVSPAEAMAAVKRIYKTASKSFNVQVTIALANSPAFKRTGRGQYLRKGGAGVGAPAKRGPKPKMGRRGRKAGKRGRKPGRPKGSKNKKPAAAAAAPAAS